MLAKSKGGTSLNLLKIQMLQGTQVIGCFKNLKLTDPKEKS